MLGNKINVISGGNNGTVIVTDSLRSFTFKTVSYEDFHHSDLPLRSDHVTGIHSLS
jgi:hypothetical protein